MDNETLAEEADRRAAIYATSTASRPPYPDPEAIRKLAAFDEPIAATGRPDQDTLCLPNDVGCLAMALTTGGPTTGAPTAKDPLRALKGAGWAIFAISIWAGWMVVTRLDLGHSTLTVHDITAIRFGTAALLLLPVLLRHGPLARSVGLGGTALMMAGAGAPYALVAASGLLYAPAAQAGALIPGVMPLFATTLSILILRESVPRDRLGGLALIPFGVTLLLGPSLLYSEGQRWIGQLLFVGAALMWATYTVTLRRSGLKPLHGAAVVAFWSACLYLPVYLLTPVTRGISTASWTSIALQVVFQGVLSSIVSLVAFNRAVALLGASRAAVFASLVPALAAIIAVPVLGEVPTRIDIAGIALISTGVLLGSGAISGWWHTKQA